MRYTLLRAQHINRNSFVTYTHTKSLPTKIIPKTLLENWARQFLNVYYYFWLKKKTFPCNQSIQESRGKGICSISSILTRRANSIKTVSFPPTDLVPNTLHKLYSENLLLGDHLHSLILELSFAIFVYKGNSHCCPKLLDTFICTWKKQIPFLHAFSQGSQGQDPAQQVQASSILPVLAAASREKPAVITSRAGHHGPSLQSTRQPPKTAMWRSGRDLGSWAFLPNQSSLQSAHCSTGQVWFWTNSLHTLLATADPPCSQAPTFLL